MHKKLMVPMLIITLVIISSYFMYHSNNTVKAASSDNVNLVLDSMTFKNMLPKNFRMTSDLTNIRDNKNLTLKGLEKLNISGSQQFSEFNLPNIVNLIGTTAHITVVDLRQESHGFINGLPVSWADSKNNANAGLTREEVLLDEANRLGSIKLNVPISFYNHPKEQVVPKKVQSEEQLVKANNLFYSRIPVRDGGIPSDEMVDYFMDFIKKQSKDSWIHFHCKEGVGRTSTFMIMYDMVKNYKDVSADDIIKRQLALAPFDEKSNKFFLNTERTDFLNQFYNYCKANDSDFNIKWSQWKKGDYVVLLSLALFDYQLHKVIQPICS